MSRRLSPKPSAALSCLPGANTDTPLGLRPGRPPSGLARQGHVPPNNPGTALPALTDTSLAFGPAATPFGAFGKQIGAFY